MPTDTASPINTSPWAGLAPGSIAPAAIGFDIDGVVADTAEAFLRIAREEYAISISLEEIVQFDVEACLPMERDTITAIFQRLMENPLAEALRPMPGAIAALETLARHAPLTFITARPLHEPIRQWLTAMLSPAASRRMTLVAMGAHDDKARYIRHHGLSYFVDDRAETCVNLAGDTITPIVYRQPWNDGKHTLPQVENWSQILSLCLGVAGDQ